MTFDVQVFDTNHNHLADMMQATTEDILKLIRKGMVVINQSTGTELHEQDILSMVGCSDCVIEG